MKVIKPQTLGLLTRPYEFRREFWLGIATIAFLPIGDAPALLPEAAMWPMLAEELPPDVPLDAAIPKAVPEFLAMAQACAPGGRADGRFPVGIQIGPRLKMLDVMGDRDFDGSHVSDPRPFVSLRLDWTNTFGGANVPDNPVGKGAEALANRGGRITPLPNVVYNARHGAAATVPAGFAPIDQMWPSRAALRGTYDDQWLAREFPGLAGDIDWRFFNVAPSDQWFPEGLRGDEAYAFKNLHPTVDLLRGKLPAMAPRLFLVRKGQEDTGFEEVALSLSTVWAFPHRERLVLIHHGRARLAEEDGTDIARVVMGVDKAGALRPAEAFRAVMELRLDRQKGMLHALRDADLVPPDWLRPDPVLDKPASGEPSALDQMLAASRVKAEAELAAANADAAAKSPDPAAFVPATLPPPRPIPTLDTLPEALEEADRERAEGEAKAMVEMATARADAIARLAAQGKTEKEIGAALVMKPKGPPAFSAAGVLAELEQQATAARLLGQLTIGLEEQIADPAFRARLDKAEGLVRTGYRLSAHAQTRADPATPERNTEIRRLLAQDTAAARALYDLHGVDLAGLDLSGLDLSGVCLDGANLVNASFAGANLTNAVLAHALMDGCVFDGADLSGANLGGGRLPAARFAGAILKKTVLAKADLWRASFAGADLDGADLADANLLGCDFTRANAPNLLLMNARLRGLRAPGIVLSKAKLIDCDLTGADLSDAGLEKTVFIGCKLDQASLAGARAVKAVFVNKCSLAGADLTEVNLTGANLREVALPGANLTGAILDQADFSLTDASGIDLTGARAIGSRWVAADLRWAEVRWTNLSNADLARADLRGANMTEASIYEGNLARVKLDGQTVRARLHRTRARYLPTYQPPVPAP